tara:strand:- start:958 stop:1254 length:297 start_codon:yes stop_codon:yes gene_type:complete
MKHFISIDEGVLSEGVEYSVGTSDGKIFNGLVYTGTKNFAGKSMMCFKTQHDSQVTINPSYNSFTIEEEGQFITPKDLERKLDESKADTYIQNKIKER